jgi:hypothetical protein
MDAPHISLLGMEMPCTVRVDVHAVPLLDDLQLVVGRRHLRLQLGLLVPDLVDPHQDLGICDERVIL